ncbi:tigger transposable element-derived protein 4-like [Argopecten irradians]|uniref:tigger transposable element-derived protein 4-like n=1 Tax=Argopecten irradians TaxID=31199 RepID=UPI0037212A5A
MSTTTPTPTPTTQKSTTQTPTTQTPTTQTPTTQKSTTQTPTTMLTLTTLTSTTPTTQSKKRKRNDLSLADKYEVVKLLNQKTSQTEIAKKLGCSQSQISRISAKKEEIIASYEASNNPDRKRQRSGKSADVETALYTWFKDDRARDVPISGPLLEEKARDIATNLDVPNFNPSSGWLSRWKTRFNITFKRLHGEKKDADSPAADYWTTNVLPQLLDSYQPADIYNADETGIYYRALPDGTLAAKSESVSGSKKAKDRITALVATNMDGSDKRKLLIIGKSLRPRCLRGKSVPATYTANKNAWMTSTIFEDWLRDFNRDMRLQGRKILLLVDNCAAHPASLTNSSHIKLIFLPPNTTSIIQPCDQGIIRNLKLHYRRQMVTHIINLIDDGDLHANDLARKVNVLDAIHMLTRAWRAVTPTTISNCYSKAGFRPLPASDDNDDLTTQNTEPTPTHMTRDEFEEYVDIDATADCHGEVSTADLCDTVRPTPTYGSDDDDDADEDEVTLRPTPSEVQHAYQIIRLDLEYNNCTDYSDFYNLQNRAECLRESTKQQKKITEFINWIP